MNEQTEKEELLKRMPAWYVELRNAYLKQAEAEEKRRRDSNKLFGQAQTH